jgi:hypothetical protein
VEKFILAHDSAGSDPIHVKLPVLSHLVIGPGSAAEQKLLAGIRQSYGGPVVVGHDPQVF